MNIKLLPLGASRRVTTFSVVLAGLMLAASFSNAAGNETVRVETHGLTASDLSQLPTDVKRILVSGVELQPDVAEILARHDAMLSIRLDKLSRESAVALAQHRGRMDVAVKSSVPKEVMEAIQAYRGRQLVFLSAEDTVHISNTETTLYREGAEATNEWESRQTESVSQKATSDTADALANEDDDMGRLQGLWRETNEVGEGREEGTPTNTHFLFRGQRMWIHEADSLTPGFEVSLDPSVRPKQITLSLGGRVIKGIYDFEKSGLRLCLSVAGQPRPSEFTSTEGRVTRLVELRREEDTVISNRITLLSQGDSAAVEKAGVSPAQPSVQMSDASTQRGGSPRAAVPRRRNPLTWDKLLEMTGPEGPSTRYIRNADGSLRRVEARYKRDLLVAVTEVDDGFRVTLGNELAIADFASRPWFTAQERDGMIDAYSEFVAKTAGSDRPKTIGRFKAVFEDDPEFRIKKSVLLTPAD